MDLKGLSMRLRERLNTTETTCLLNTCFPSELCPNRLGHIDKNRACKLWVHPNLTRKVVNGIAFNDNSVFSHLTAQQPSSF